MARKRRSPEECVNILHEASKHGIAETVKKHNITETTFYLWKRMYGGMEISEIRDGDVRLIGGELSAVDGAGEDLGQFAFLIPSDMVRPGLSEFCGSRASHSGRMRETRGLELLPPPSRPIGPGGA